MSILLSLFLMVTFRANKKKNENSLSTNVYSINIQSKLSSFVINDKFIYPSSVYVYTSIYLFMYPSFLPSIYLQYIQSHTYKESTIQYLSLFFTYIILLTTTIISIFLSLQPTNLTKSK